MSTFAFFLVLAGNLEMILEFGSVSFLLVSLLMAYANYRIRDLTASSVILTLLAFFGLMAGTLLILYYEFSDQPKQMLFIVGIYLLLTLVSLLYAKSRRLHTDK